MSKRSIFVCFIGIDGSGKTTLSKMLVENMKRKGFKSKYVYHRSRPFITRPIMDIGEILFLRGKDIFSNYEEYSSTKKTLFKNHFFFKVYQNILLFDYFIQTIIKIKIPLILGINVVCDRYIYDTVVTDLAAYVNLPIYYIKKLLERWLKLFPKPDLVFLIDVPEDIAYKRKDDTPSIEYLKERRYIYLELGKEYKMTILDGSSNLEELKNLVECIVERWVRRSV